MPVVPEPRSPGGARAAPPVALLSLHRQGQRSFLVDLTLHLASGELTRAGVPNDLVVAELPAMAEGSAELGQLLALLRDYPTIVYERVWSLDLARALRQALPGAVLVRLVGEHDLPEAPADHVVRGDAARLASAMVALLGLGPPIARPAAYLPNLRPRVVPAGASPLPRAFPIEGHGGCPHRADARANPLFAGLALPEGVGRGCSFCVTGRVAEDRPHAEVVDAVLEQLRYLRRHAPEVRDFVLRDQRPFSYLGALVARVAAEQLGPLTLLLESRADWLLRHEAEMVAALETARPSAIRLAPFLVGIESFSQPELDRFNKGLRVETSIALIARLRQWQRRFAPALDLSQAAFGFILFTPWTTLADLRANLQAMVATRFDQLRGQLLLSRLRLYPDTALYYLAERDGLLGDGCAERSDDPCVRYGYFPAVPWRYVDASVARIAELAPLVLERRGGRDELAILAALLALGEQVASPAVLTVERVERELDRSPSVELELDRSPSVERELDRSPSVERFRDAPAPAEERLRLRLELGRCLLGAPTLPVDLPLFGTRLRDVQASAAGIELELGRDTREATLRLRHALRSGPIAVDIELAAPASYALRRALPVIAERLRRALTAERWSRAWPLAQRLGALPVPAPRQHQRQLVAGLRSCVGLVRSTFRCNQDCDMCWQDRRWAGADAAQLALWLEDLRRAGAEGLILSGGEPTLEPGLPRLVAHARELGFTQVTLETNAVTLARDGLAARLRDAGLTAGFVSFHSGDARVSDALTRAPGTHVQTLRGVEALLAAGLAVGVNAVLAGEALGTLPALPRYLARAFGSALRLGLTLSYPVAPFDRRLLRQILPEPAQLRAALARTIEQAASEALSLRGLDGPCGPPLCAFDADPRVTARRPLLEALGSRRYVAACARCALRAACFGVSRAALEAFGEAAVLPFGVDGPEQPGRAP
jgi:uncharacterized radical SAM superfamily Fe-S cluster-containing enzyme